MYLRLTSFGFSVRTLEKYIASISKTQKYIEEHIARNLCISFFSTVLFESICNYDKCLAKPQP